MAAIETLEQRVSELERSVRELEYGRVSVEHALKELQELVKK